jgi:hypothetical protein
MGSQICPHCKQSTFGYWHKYLAAKWKLLTCPSCERVSCSFPFPLVFYTMLYVWDVLLFGYLTYFTGNTWYILALIVGWLILDYFSLFLPLSPLKRKGEQPQ